jgi:RNA polymerase sigma-54 factor
MAIELKQQVRLSQQLVMTPQLQQAIKLLQLNQIELVSLVQEELQENPVLEESDVSEDATPAEVADGTPGEQGAGGEDFADVSAAGEASTPDADGDPSNEADRDPSNEEKIADVDWDNYMDAYPQTGLNQGSGNDTERPSIEATLTRGPNLSEHLQWQIQLSGFEEAELEVAKWIIGNLDDQGYLRATVEDLSGQSGHPEDLVELVLKKVQLLDPAGVAARDLRECLLTQIDALRIQNGLVRQIVDQHLDLLERRDFRKLSRVTGAELSEIAIAAGVIGSLEPRPGRPFGGNDPVYITPDIYVYKVGDDFHILLNEDGLPRLRINGMYRGVLSKGSDASRDTRDYVSEKVRSAVWLIKSIHQRQRTIYRVMESIAKFQREFFEKGISELRPLNLRDVADDIEMHESTVSRVTTNKYVHTPQGIYELKFFFTSSVSSLGGEPIASESVKERIRKIIANEDPRRPLSDQRIAEMLKAADIVIARRTVTKYREALRILSSTKRRQIG